MEKKVDRSGSSRFFDRSLSVLSLTGSSPSNLILPVQLWPYSLNPLFNMGPTRGRTRNWDDSLKIYQESHENGHNPTFEVEPLGGVVTQGLIGYITVGVDMKAKYESKWNPLSGKAGAVKN